MLLQRLGAVVQGWQPVFPQGRTYRRAVVQSVAGVCGTGRRTLSQGMHLLGRAHRDWSAEYRLLSRSRWDAQALFGPILGLGHHLAGRDCLGVAIDDTRLRKSGRKIPGASWHADPLSPSFHPNLIWAARYIQAALLLPQYRHGGQAARGLPVAFVEAPAPRRPGKRATEIEKAAYRKAKKVSRLSLLFPDLVQRLRTALDNAGAHRKRMILAVDGSYCNRWGLAVHAERTATIARARKDAKLCRPATEKSRVYDTEVFTPEQVRQSPDHPWKQAHIFHGGRYRTVFYKEVQPVLWRGATRRQPLRLFVLRPTRYRNKSRKGGKHYYYRKPAYLLTNDLRLPAQSLLQKYFDRWQIEVNHREEKDVLGVGQAQVRSELSVPRQPAMAVAAYSAVLLAGVLAYGNTMPSDLPSNAAWYTAKKRLTFNDLANVLRNELLQIPPDQRADYILDTIGAHTGYNNTMPNVQT
jgi:hypothetical protein